MASREEILKKFDVQWDPDGIRLMCWTVWRPRECAWEVILEDYESVSSVSERCLDHWFEKHDGIGDDD